MAFSPAFLTVHSMSTAICCVVTNSDNTARKAVMKISCCWRPVSHSQSHKYSHPMPNIKPFFLHISGGVAHVFDVCRYWPNTGPNMLTTCRAQQCICRLHSAFWLHGAPKQQLANHHNEQQQSQLKKYSKKKKTKIPPSPSVFSSFK